MSTAAAVRGAGATFETSADNSSFTAIGGITKIGRGDIAVEDIDITDMGTPDNFREFMAGWADAGQITLELKMVNSQSTAFFNLLRQDRYLRITFSNGAKWTCPGYMRGHGDDAELEGYVKCRGIFKLSGKPIFAAAS